MARQLDVGEPPGLLPNEARLAVGTDRLHVPAAHRPMDQGRVLNLDNLLDARSVPAARFPRRLATRDNTPLSCNAPCRPPSRN
eukprot:4778002-Pyramimonas_sp.AAC.1